MTSGESMAVLRMTRVMARLLLVDKVACRLHVRAHERRLLHAAKKPKHRELFLLLLD